MHIEFDWPDDTGRTLLRAIREDGDQALPVDSLIFDTGPVAVNHDQVAIAGVLLFGALADRTVRFANEISVAAADAIRSATGLEVSSTVSDVPSTPEQGDPLRVTTLSVGLAGTLAPFTPEIDRTRLELIPGSRFQGALFGIKEAVIASNAWFVSTRIDPASVLAAAGVLFSQDLLAKEVTVSTADESPIAPTASDQALCSAIGLGLS